MSKLINNQIILAKYQMEVILDILIKNNLITKEDFNEMVKEKIESTLMFEDEKSDVLSLIND